MEDRKLKATCSYCGNEQDSGTFCKECGKELIFTLPSTICPSCDFEQEEGKFCQECGKELHPAGAPAPVEAIPSLSTSQLRYNPSIQPSNLPIIQ